MDTDPERQRRIDKNRNLWRYGISVDRYEELLAMQGGRCAICQSADPRGKGGFHVDHCHTTGTVRGLLCHFCNIGIGNMGDDPDILGRAETYLRGRSR